MADWRDAPAVELLAKGLIQEYHQHLVLAKIKYLFREGPWSSQKKETWAKAYKVSDRDKFLHGYDFLVVINDDVWKELDLSARIALVDHELAHCGVGENGWCVWPHDVEDFIAVVSRHGAWMETVKQYLKAAENQKLAEFERQGQMLLDDFLGQDAEATEDKTSTEPVTSGETGTEPDKTAGEAELGW
ncbi:MAG: putative metallopeptidase [Bacillota bacterium]